MTVKYEVATGNHLFIGGILNGVIKKITQKDKGNIKYLAVPIRTTAGYAEQTYENMGYAMLYRDVKL